VDKALLERRTELLQQHAKGIPLKLSVQDLSGKYNRSEKQMYSDWERRKKWIPQIVQLNDPTLLHVSIEGAKSVLPKAWLLLQDTANDFVKLGALRLIKDTNIQILEILQSVGAVEKKPEQLKLDLAIGDGKDIINLLEQYDAIFKPVEERTPRKDNLTEQVDSASTNTQTS
jgi:hypothetical protein